MGSYRARNIEHPVGKEAKNNLKKAFFGLYIYLKFLIFYAPIKTAKHEVNLLIQMFGMQ